MWNNLFISFELATTTTDRTNLEKAIQDLGNCTKLHNSCWYVNSPHTAAQATKRLGSVIGKGDILVIADTTNDCSAWLNLTPMQSTRVRQNWRLNKAPKGSKRPQRASHPAGNA